jgi:hypothetical protein
MTIRLHLHTCNIGQTSRTYENPFNGARVEFPVDPGLNDLERANVRKLMMEMQGSSPDSDGYRKILCGDGGAVSICIGTLDDPDPCVAFAVEFNRLTSEVALFVFNLARCGNMTVGSTINPEVAILANPPNESIIERWPSVTVVSTPGQLMSWLQQRVADRSIV